MYAAWFYLIFRNAYSDIGVPTDGLMTEIFRKYGKGKMIDAKASEDTRRDQRYYTPTDELTDKTDDDQSIPLPERKQYGQTFQKMSSYVKNALQSQHGAAMKKNHGEPSFSGKLSTIFGKLISAGRLFSPSAIDLLIEQFARLNPSIPKPARMSAANAIRRIFKKQLSGRVITSLTPNKRVIALDFAHMHTMGLWRFMKTWRKFARNRKRKKLTLHEFFALPEVVATFDMLIPDIEFRTTGEDATICHVHATEEFHDESGEFNMAPTINLERKDVSTMTVGEAWDFFHRANEYLVIQNPMPNPRDKSFTIGYRYTKDIMEQMQKKQLYIARMPKFTEEYHPKQFLEAHTKTYRKIMYGMTWRERRKITIHDFFQLPFINDLYKLGEKEIYVHIYDVKSRKKVMEMDSHKNTIRQLYTAIKRRDLFVYVFDPRMGFEFDKNNAFWNSPNLPNKLNEVVEKFFRGLIGENRDGTKSKKRNETVVLKKKVFFSCSTQKILYVGFNKPKILTELIKDEVIYEITSNSPPKYSFVQKLVSITSQLSKINTDGANNSVSHEYLQAEMMVNPKYCMSELLAIEIPVWDVSIPILGHIDFLFQSNGALYIADYKPDIEGHIHSIVIECLPQLLLYGALLRFRLKIPIKINCIIFNQHNAWIFDLDEMIEAIPDYIAPYYTGHSLNHFSWYNILSLNRYNVKKHDSLSEMNFENYIADDYKEKLLQASSPALQKILLRMDLDPMDPKYIPPKEDAVLKQFPKLKSLAWEDIPIPQIIKFLEKKYLSDSLQELIVSGLVPSKIDFADYLNQRKVILSDGSSQPTFSRDQINKKLKDKYGSGIRNAFFTEFDKKNWGNSIGNRTSDTNPIVKGSMKYYLYQVFLDSNKKYLSVEEINKELTTKQFIFRKHISKLAGVMVDPKKIKDNCIVLEKEGLLKIWSKNSSLRNNITDKHIFGKKVTIENKRSKDLVYSKSDVYEPPKLDSVEERNPYVKNSYNFHILNAFFKYELPLTFDDIVEHMKDVEIRNSNVVYKKKSDSLKLKQLGRHIVQLETDGFIRIEGRKLSRPNRRYYLADKMDHFVDKTSLKPIKKVVKARDWKKNPFQQNSLRYIIYDTFLHPTLYPEPISWSDIDKHTRPFEIIQSTGHVVKKAGELMKRASLQAHLKGMMEKKLILRIGNARNKSTWRYHLVK